MAALESVSNSPALHQQYDFPDGPTRQTDGSPIFALRHSVTAKMWLVTVVIIGMAAGVAWGVAPGTVFSAGIRLQWWHLAPLFYLAEVAVVHLHFRRNAHSYSMSEIPLIIALVFASPVDLLIGQLVGNAAALAITRRQTALKLSFNLGQFTLVNGIAILVFRLLVTAFSPSDPRSWVAAFLAAGVVLVLGDSLVHVAISITGGRLDRKSLFEVYGLSAGAAFVNAAQGMVAATLLWVVPNMAWVAVIPPLVLFVAYRAYMTQRAERGRLESIYSASRKLHAAPQIDRAVETAVALAVEMFEAERTEVILFGGDDRRHGYRTTAISRGTVRLMQPVFLGSGRQIWDGALKASEVKHLEGIDVLDLFSTDDGEIEELLIAPLEGTQGPAGVMLVINRLGDVSRFGEQDVRFLGTLAGQVSVSLENGRLEDSLAELTLVKDQLEQQVRARDQFVASVSHELRTPLTGILGLSHALIGDRSEIDDFELDDILVMIANQSAELSNIVEDLLVGARADAGTLFVKTEEIEIKGQIESVLAGHALLGSDGGVDVPVSLNVNRVVADPLRLRQIVRNLLTNAACYGGKDVRIDVRPGPDDDVIISVQDDGMGVPPNRVDAIFEAYERAHDAAGQPASVGLGLAVARKLARLMGGDLQYLRYGQTTAFELALPKAPVETVFSEAAG